MYITTEYYACMHEMKNLVVVETECCGFEGPFLKLPKSLNKNTCGRDGFECCGSRPFLKEIVALVFLPHSLNIYL